MTRCHGTGPRTPGQAAAPSWHRPKQKESPGRKLCCLGEDSFDDFAVHVGQSKVATCLSVCQSTMIETEQVQDGGVQVVHVNRVLGDFHPELVADAVSDATLYPTTGEQN